MNDYSYQDMKDQILNDTMAVPLQCKICQSYLGFLDCVKRTSSYDSLAQMMICLACWNHKIKPLLTGAKQ